MHLMTIRNSSGPRLCVRRGDDLVDVNSADNRIPPDLGAFLSHGGTIGDLSAVVAGAKGECVLAQGEREHDLPLSRPGKILCLGLNYLEHVKEGPYQVPDYPTIFMRGATSLVAQGKPIVRPLISDKLDFEEELAVVIGSRVRHATQWRGDAARQYGEHDVPGGRDYCHDHRGNHA